VGTSEARPDPDDLAGGGERRASVTAAFDARTLRRVRHLLVVVVVLLALGNALALVFRHLTGNAEVFGFVEFADLAQELSLGTWIASLLLLATGALAGISGVADDREGGRWRRNWYALGALLAFMSLDEVAVVHERVADLTRRALDTSGAFHFAWTIPAAVIVVVFAVAQARFVRGLPAPTRRRLLLAGAVFVGGAMGLELVESAVYTSAGNVMTATFDVLSAVEEVLELTAVSLALLTLAEHLLASQAAVRIAPDRLDDVEPVEHPPARVAVDRR
jgi:hypothetical protein